MSERTQNMLIQATHSPTELLEYNKLRSKNSSAWIFSVEGKDDIHFYQVVCQRLNFPHTYKFLLCNGKDKVLNLHQTLRSSIAATGIDLTKFFIDHDFDGLKGHHKSDALYCTPSYSIENLLISESVLREILISTFLCIGEEEEESISKVIELYRLRINDFNRAIKAVNLKLFFARKKGLQGEPRGIDRKLVKKFLDIDLCQIQQKTNCNDSIDYLLGFDNIPSCNELEHEFEIMKPCRDWRGKFHYDFFVKFIELLASDRSSSSPTIFSRKRGINFQAGQSHIQNFAIFFEIPMCLKHFLAINS